MRREPQNRVAQLGSSVFRAGGSWSWAGTWSRINRDLLVVPVATFAKVEDLSPDHIYYLNEDGTWWLRGRVLPMRERDLGRCPRSVHGVERGPRDLDPHEDLGRGHALSRDESWAREWTCSSSDLADDLPTVDTRPWAEIAKAVTAPTWFADLAPFRAVVLATAEALPESPIWSRDRPLVGRAQGRVRLWTCYRSSQSLPMVRAPSQGLAPA